jgi:hypothetical protein
MMMKKQAWKSNEASCKINNTMMMKKQSLKKE